MGFILRAGQGNRLAVIVAKYRSVGFCGGAREPRPTEAGNDISNEYLPAGAPCYRLLTYGGSPSGGRGTPLHSSTEAGRRTPLTRTVKRYICLLLMSFRPKRQRSGEIPCGSSPIAILLLHFRPYLSAKPTVGRFALGPPTGNPCGQVFKAYLSVTFVFAPALVSTDAPG